MVPLWTLGAVRLESLASCSPVRYTGGEKIPGNMGLSGGAVFTR